MDKILLQVAVDNDSNRIVSIYEVMNGIKCNCRCPDCNKPLIAKNKNKKANEPLLHGQKEAHFAHFDGSECEYANETAIHLLAKEVLLESKTLLLPQLPSYGKSLIKSCLMKFDWCKEEAIVKTDDSYIKPDIILTKQKQDLFVEFYKTHSVDDNKVSQIKKLNVSCIEIDVNGIEPLKDGKPNKHGLIQLFESKLFSKTWLHNRKLEKLEKRRESKINKSDDFGSDSYTTHKDENFLNDDDDTILNGSRVWDEEKLNQWKRGLKDKGYKFLKIYNKKFYDYDYYDSSHSRRYLSVEVEYIYCPKLKHTTKETIQLEDCERCTYYYKRLKNHKNDWCVACGFKNKLATKKWR